jgi:murein DD-endopeptidase MepM/ murein hydrolase activator NlpD
MTKPTRNKSAFVSSEYGERVLNGAKEFHGGIDIAVPSNPEGVPIYAAYAGTVGAIIKDASISCGRAVFVKRNDADYYCLYFHLDTVNADLVVGERIVEGDFIGIMGNTGHSFGNHLHYGHRKTMTSGSETYNPEEIRKLYK